MGYPCLALNPAIDQRVVHLDPYSTLWLGKMDHYMRFPCLVSSCRVGEEVSTFLNMLRFLQGYYAARKASFLLDLSTAVG